MTTRLDKILAVALMAGVLLVVAVLAEGAWVGWRYQQAQTALDRAAQAASLAVDATELAETGRCDLHGQARGVSAYAVAQAELERWSDAALRLVTLVCDGEVVIATGTLTVPTFLLRALGWPQLPLQVFSRASLVY